jgi:hypothetical protein
MAAAKTASDSISNVSFTRFHRKLPSFRLMLSMDLAPPALPWRASLITGQMATILEKENSPCSMVLTANLLDRLDLMVNLSTTTRHHHLMAMPRNTRRTRLPTWHLTLLRLDHRMKHRGRLNPPSMMIVSV